MNYIVCRKKSQYDAFVQRSKLLLVIKHKLKIVYLAKLRRRNFKNICFGNVRRESPEGIDI